ncbi:MAG: Na+/H+ antiporter subunit E [Desulfurococcaceae archaeon]
MFKYVAVWLLVFLIYVLFAGSASLYTLATGALIAAILSALTARYIVVDERKVRDVKRLLILAYYFVKYMTVIEFKAHMDVVKRTFTGDIKPGIVRVPVGVKSKYARLLVALSITNTPGTVVVDEKNGYFYVNWIYVSTVDPAEAREAISREFEEYAYRIFE